MRSWLYRVTALLSAAFLLAQSPANATLDDVFSWSTTAGSNTDTGGVSIAESAPFANMNNALREMMAQLRREVAGTGSDISSVGGAPAICATGTSKSVSITGTTTITSLGTANAGCWRIVTFTGALTITHNGTSLILPSATNITTAAGDVAGFLSLGSGNWRMVFYSRVPLLGVANTFTAAQTISVTATGTVLQMTSSDAGAVGGPNADFFRNSASPAASDVLGGFTFNGKDSGGTTTEYANVTTVIVDPTDTSEDGRLRFVTTAAGSSAARFNIEAGLYGVGATGGDKGAGTVNGTGVYIHGHGTVAQQPACDTEVGYTTLGTIMPFDNTIPQNTEGDEIMTVSITPTNASSVLDIRVSIPTIGGAAQLQALAALFVDTTADALAMGTGTVPGTANTTSIQFQHSVSAGSTSARTYKVRAGSAVASDAKLNGDNSARVGGGISAATLCVTEILPQ